MTPHSVGKPEPVILTVSRLSAWETARLGFTGHHSHAALCKESVRKSIWSQLIALQWDQPWKEKEGNLDFGRCRKSVLVLPRHDKFNSEQNKMNSWKPRAHLPLLLSSIYVLLNLIKSKASWAALWCVNRKAFLFSKCGCCEIITMEKICCQHIRLLPAILGMIKAINHHVIKCSRMFLITQQRYTIVWQQLYPHY